MDRAELKAKIAYILRFDCWGKEITFNDLPDGKLYVDLDCYALTGTAAGELANLSRALPTGFIITTQDTTKKLQLRF